MRIRDDGKGIDRQILGETERAGHYGLHGMRERAKLMGGNLGDLERFAIRNRN